MASILQFRPVADRKPKERSEFGSASGEVVIFPGVRIERHETDPDGPEQEPRRHVPGGKS